MGRQNQSVLLSEYDWVDDLVNITSHFGVKHAAYFGLELPHFILPEPFFVATYPAHWIEHYRAQGYVEHDPVLHQVAREIMPTNWSSLKESNPIARKMFMEAEVSGIGNQGITVPIRGPNGETAIFSLINKCSDQEWTRLLQDQMAQIQFVAHQFHTNVVEKHGLGNQYHLSRREKEVLEWLAAGKTQEDVADILHLSVHTIQTYIQSARYKLNAINTAHTVARAIRMKLVRPRD
ncbi:MAG: LuxR family transcriptional regulator [Pseudomonadota bacterium]